MRLRLPALALLLVVAAGALPAREYLRLPWVFSDEPDLTADLGFSPGGPGRTHVDVVLGGRFAHFGLPSGALRAPQLDITCAFTDPSRLERSAVTLKTRADLELFLAGYGLRFARRWFGSDSPLLYKAELEADLPPGDYNLSLTMRDAGMGFESHRTLYVIVPELAGGRWQVGDLRFITGVGRQLDMKGREQRLLDPNPWRQVGGQLGWDLLVAYNDLGPRPPGALSRVHRIRRLLSGQVVWQESGGAPAKKAGQVWLVRVPASAVRLWKGGIYQLEVGLRAGDRSVTSSKTFEVLP
jgi:hypothetical protein